MWFSSGYKAAIEWLKTHGVEAAVLGFLAVAAACFALIVWHAYATYRALKLNPSALPQASSSQNLVHAWTRLYHRLAGLILDYLLKLSDLIKNLFYFPICTDHKRFKKTWQSYDFSTVPWTQKTITNYAYLPFKGSYILLCLLALVIPVWVYSSVKSSMSAFYPSSVPIDTFALGIALVIYFCDVVVIRTLSAGLVGVKLNASTGNGKLIPKLVVSLFRCFVVLCTAIILSFSVLPPLFISDLNIELRDREVKRLKSTEEYRYLSSERTRLAQEIFLLKAKHYCAGFALTGLKPGEAFAYDSKEFSGILQTLPAPGTDESGTLALVTPPATIGCRAFLDPEEEICISKRAGPECKNTQRLAKEVITDAVRLFGVSDRARIYEIAGVTEFMGRQYWSTPKGNARAAEYETFSNRVDKFTSRVERARELNVSLRPNEDDEGTGTDVEDAELDTERREVESDEDEPVYEEAVPPRLDVNDVARVVTSKLGLSTSNLGAALPLALIVIFVMFELLILVYKSYGSYDALESLDAKIIGEHMDFLNSGTVGKVLLSDMETKSDWSIGDHLFAVVQALGQLVVATASTAFRGALFAVAPLLCAGYLIYDFFKSSWIFGVVGKVLKNFAL
jgi:hypothetical protein